jgi:hypothetical protein
MKRTSIALTLGTDEGGDGSVDATAPVGDPH